MFRNWKLKIYFYSEDKFATTYSFIDQKKKQQMLFIGHQDAPEVMRAEITERDHVNWCIISD